MQLQARCEQNGHVPVRHESQVNRSALITRRSNAKRNPHAITGTRQNVHTTILKVDANGGHVRTQAHRQSW